MLTNKLHLAKEIVLLVSALFLKLLKQEPKDAPDWIISDIWILLSFIFVDRLLGNTFFILVVCLVVRNN